MSVDPVSLAITVALDAASMALQASKRIEGPRVTDLNATVADYGTPLNYVYGIRRVAGACFYCEPIKEQKHHTKGKGGKYTEFRYFGTFAIIVVDQRISAYRRIWFDEHLVYDITGSVEVVTDPTDNSTLAQFMRQYVGDQTAPDPRMVANITDKEGPDRCPAYLDISYLMFEALPLEFLGNRFPQVSVEVDAGAGGTLGDICSDVATRSGMAVGDLDFSALDQSIYGFSWTIADCKSIIAPLLDVYDSDIILHDFGLIGRQRGGELDDQFVIASDFMVRQQRGKPDSSHQPLYQITMEAESDLPRRVFATFSDRTADQQPNTAVAQRDIASTATVRELPLDVTNLALSPDEAQPLVERYLRRQWIGGTKYNYTAAPWEIALECGDIRISDLDGEQLRGRLTRLTLKADRSLAAEWEVDGALPISAGIPVLQFQSFSTPTFTQPAGEFAALQTSIQIRTEPDNQVLEQVDNFPWTGIDPRPANLWPSDVAIGWYVRRDDVTEVYDFFTPGDWLVAADNYLLAMSAGVNDAVTGAVDYDAAIANLAFRWRIAVVASLDSPEAAVVLSAEPWTDVGSELITTDVTRRFSIDGSGTDFSGTVLGSRGTLTGDVGTIIASPGASAIGRPPSQIFDPTPSRPFILDVPLVSDADDQTTPFVYLTAGRDASGGTFPGAEIQQSDTGADGTWTSGWDSVASNAEAIWGNCSTVLGNALPWIPDRANTLTVDLPNGTLESLDDEFLNANPSANLAAIGTFGGGWEIVQFGVAEIISGTVWHVSNFYRRGAGGTERFVGTHGAGELFVLLSALVKHDLGAGKIGDTDYYVAVTNTTSPAYSDDLPVDFEAQPHRPLSPVHVALTRNAGSGDWSGTFVRRTRVGGGALNGQDVPLGEASQSYRVKVMNGASVVRTINVTTPSFTYVAADQTTDFGSHQLALTVQICQVDPTLGIEGAATTASA